MFHSLCHAGSVVTPSANDHPYTPITSIDAATNSMAISHTCSQFDQDCFIYKTGTAPAADDLSEHHSLPTLPCSLRQANLPDMPYCMQGSSNNSGLDDSLEDTLPTITSDINLTSKAESFFHEDIASWLHPIESDNLSRSRTVQYQCEDNNSTLDWNNIQDESKWNQKEITNPGNPPHSCEVNFEFPNQDGSAIGDHNFNQSLNCPRMPLQSYNEASGINNFYCAMPTSESHPCESLHSRMQDQCKERSWNNETLHIRKCEPSSNSCLFSNIITSSSATHNALSHSNYNMAENAFIPGFSNLSNPSQSSVFSQYHSTNSGPSPERSTMLQFHQPLPTALPIPNHSLATQVEWSAIPWQLQDSVVSEAARVPAQSTSKNLSIPRSTKIIASSTVRKPSSFSMMNRKPVKALDLDVADKRNLMTMKSNDRDLLSETNFQTQNSLSENGNLYSFALKDEVVRSKYFASPTLNSLGHRRP